MPIIMEAITEDERDVMERLRADVRAAGYPETFRTSQRNIDVVEGYFKRIQDEAVARWRAAGSPDDWPEHLHVTYIGKNGGLMFRAVELLA